MIKTEKLTINGMPCVKTYSDTGCYIERDGCRYEEAIDPAYTGRTYSETDIGITTELTAEEALEELREALEGSEQ